MKNQQIKNLKRYAIVVCLSLLAQSCENPLDTPEASDLYGRISLDMKVELTISESNARLSEVLTDNFKVEIRTADDQIYQTYDRLADVPTSIPLEPGNYYVRVQSPNENAVAFENPFYEGESDLFSLNYGDEKVIPITAVMANCMISVIYQPSITDNYVDYSTSITNVSGTLVFGKEEVRPGYFPTEALEIVATLHYLNADGTSTTKTITGSIPDPQSQTHYQVNLEAGQVNGTGSLSVMVDETLFSEIIHITEETMIPVEGPILYGDLLITEIMYNPAAITDTEGEWFEIYNASLQPIDLFQVVIKKGSEVQHVINEHVILNAGEHLVLARNINATSLSGYIYGSSLSLTNSGDDIILANYGDNGTNGSAICSVNFGSSGFPDANGASLNLDPGAYDVEMAKSGINWCLSSSIYDTGDLGTPGGMNDPCTL